MATDTLTAEHDAPEMPFTCPKPGENLEWDRNWKMAETLRRTIYVNSRDLRFLDSICGRTYLTAPQYRVLCEVFGRLNALSGSVE
jgi:hypothetical protein